MNMIGLINIAAALVLAPLVPGIINRTKAKFAGRKGAPLLQNYYDIIKLLRKGAVISWSATWISKIGPAISLVAVMISLSLLPLGGGASFLSFSGDLILFAYLLGVARFFVVLSALDAGSSFEGMGASRDVMFSALAEPTLMISLLTLARVSDSFSLSGIYSGLASSWGGHGMAIFLAAVVLFIVLLAENSRIPIDDPNTHLELTMIHEVMVLDLGGPDLAFITYGAALKLWIFSSLFGGVIFPSSSSSCALSLLSSISIIFITAIAVGVVESTMARLKMMRVPQLLSGAASVAILAFLISFLLG